MRAPFWVGSLRKRYPGVPERFTIRRIRRADVIHIAPKTGQPRQGMYPAGAVVCCTNNEDLSLGIEDSAKGPVSRILSCAVIPLGAALPRTLISDLPGGFGVFWSRLNASGRCAAPPGSRRLLPPLFGLAPCGVYLAPGLTVGAVRSYRTISPLPNRRGLKTKPVRRYIFCGTSRPRALKPASRTLSGTLPCGVRTFLPRRTALARSHRQRPPGPPARVSLPRNGAPSSGQPDLGISERTRRTITCNSGMSSSTVSQTMVRLTAK